MKNLIIQCSSILSLPSTSNIQIQFTYSVLTVDLGFALAHNTDQNMFQYLSSQLLKTQQFAEAIKFYTNLFPGKSQSSLVHRYDVNKFRPGATVVVIGRSDGHVSISIW